jgi:hypothetical protein
MNDRANILARLRRSKSGAARYVVAAFAVAYFSAGVAPCAMATPRATHDGSAAARQGHAAHEPLHSAAHAHHGHEAHGADAHDGSPEPIQHGNAHCPHCPPAAHGDETACVVLEDLKSVAASHAKDAPKPLAPLLAAVAITLPPPHASPWRPPPLRAVQATSVPLNVRHCVFLI